MSSSPARRHEREPHQAVLAHASVHPGLSSPCAGYIPGTRPHPVMNDPDPSRSPASRLHLAGAPRLGLRVRAEPERVIEVRRAMARYATEAGMEDLEVGAVELAVSEACTNVVRHAYPEATGDIEVMATADGRRLVVSVGDSGIGIRSHPGGAPQGLGMAIMLSLCDSFEVGTADGGRGPA